MAKFVSIEDIILAACMGDSDILQQKKMKYLYWAKNIWNDDLNLTTVKEAKREIIGINKRTNTLDLPCDSVGVSGVYIIGCFGEFIPVFKNDRLHDDIVDVAAAKNCACDCGHDLCNMIKGYEAVTEEVPSEMPDGSTKVFTCITRKGFDADGTYYEEKQYPQRIYTDGEWTDTVIHKEKIKLCTLELTDTGCVRECEENYHAVTACGCFAKCPTVFDQSIEVGQECIVPMANSRALYGWESGVGFARCGSYLVNSYNVTEEGNRLIFPYNFGHNRVMVRYYADVQLQDIKVPSVAKEAFIVGLKYWETLIDDDRQNLNARYAKRYGELKWALSQELNKWSIAEQRMIMTPKVFIPSYQPAWGYGNYNIFN